MKISVIIPTYNEEKVILECLESLDKQSEKDFEVIVVDDGSTDTTALKLRGASKTFPLKILDQKHLGPASARNLGAKYAKGEILVFVDSDMTFDSNFLRNLSKPIKENKTKGTFSKEEYVSNWENVWAKCWNINSNLPDKKRLPDNYPDHEKVFRAILKSEFDKVGGFSKGGYTDDWSLSEKLGYEAEASGGAVFYHRNPDNLGEVFNQAKWIAKRKYKLGIIGIFITLVKYSLPVSLGIAILKLFKIKNFQFLRFKLTYDLGIFVGLLEMVFMGKTAK